MITYITELITLLAGFVRDRIWHFKLYEELFNGLTRNLVVMVPPALLLDKALRNMAKGPTSCLGAVL
jgi:hypothetical protein